MNRIKSFFSMLMVLLFCLTILSACNDKEIQKSDKEDVGVGEEETNTNVNVSDSQEMPHETFTVWIYNFANDLYTTFNDNPGIRYMNEAFNVTFEYEHPAAGQEADSFNLMLASGEYTDVINTVYATSSLNDMYADGVIISLNDLISENMPNLSKLIAENPEIAKICSNDDGLILALPEINSTAEPSWGGLVYRKDIVDSMTDDNPEYPSGNVNPVTVEDWEYMLELMKQYFEELGLTDYAPLIIPYQGYFSTNDIISGFGAYADFYLDGDEIKFGPIESNYYNYLVKMKKWYEKGYIYKDFATRVNDLIYLPNTSLTYGGAAGVFWGLSNQLGDLMDSPDYGLDFEIAALASPIDKMNGITEANGRMDLSVLTSANYAISSSCENPERLLSIIDYLYSSEGSYLAGLGLTTEQGAADNEIYKAEGLQDGAYVLSESGEVLKNEALKPGGSANQDGNVLRLLGLPSLTYKEYMWDEITEVQQAAHDVWNTYPNNKVVPSSLYLTSDESKAFQAYYSEINDYISAMVPKFIMGIDDLTEESWLEYVQTLKDLGVDEIIKIKQAAYDRYQNR